MKISKLFHWLYAILMFLPILVFIPNAFYYGFNETAVAQEKTEQIAVYYETNEVNNATDLISGNIYHYTNNYVNSYTGSNTRLCTIDIDLFKQQFTQFRNTNITLLEIYLSNSSGLYIWVTSPNSTGVNISSTAMDFIPLLIYGDNSLLNDYFIPYVQESDRNYVKDYQPLTTSMSITDSMAYAWKSTWQNDLFSWSYDSFLKQPFLYITNLFNVPATNTLLYCLSYWLNISIIWLCFDVVMYVPLLVHRWLDKGFIE